MSLIIIVPAGTEHILISVKQTRASFKMFYLTRISLTLQYWFTGRQIKTGPQFPFFLPNANGCKPCNVH